MNYLILRNCRRCSRRALVAQSGFSLIEMMVVLVITSLMLVAVLQLFLDVTRTRDEMANTSTQMENGRFAITLLESDLLHGGFWGGYIPQFDDLTSTAKPSDFPNPYPATPAIPPAPCAPFATWDAAYKGALLGIPVQVYDSVPTGCGAVVTSKLANTDVLVVRHADTRAYPASCDAAAPPWTGGCAGYDGDKVYFQSSRCASEPLYSFVMGTGGFNLRDKSCAAGALTEIRRFVSNIYYIRNYSVTIGDGIPTLMRAEFGGDGATGWQVEPLIEGIESLVVELGVDSLSDNGAAVDYSTKVSWADPLNKTSPTNRGNGAPDGAYVHCSGCTNEQLANTVAVKVHVLARSIEPSQGYTDAKVYQLGTVAVDPADKRFKRHVYSTTVRLTNVSMRRETP